MLSAIGNKFFSLIEFDDDEELLLEIRKHYFGLWMMILSGMFIAMAALLLSILAASSNFMEYLGFDGSANGIIGLLGFVLVIFVAVLTLIFAQLYRSNVVFVTNEKLAQVLYITLFNRKISQLNIGDIQDVTVTQKGFFAHIFGYGTLVVETAGEQQNYTFTFVPHPYPAAKLIIQAHEANLKQYGN
jgi:uncharacterized membrane protein YdbT with pleckstrin-like domain